MPKARAPLCHLLTTFAVIIAVAASAFGHTAVRPAPSQELVAYVAAGGSLGDLCGTAEDQDGVPGQKCEVCRLFGSVALPDICFGVPVAVNQQARTLTFVAQLVHNSRPLDPARLTRAPPQA